MSNLNRKIEEDVTVDNVVSDEEEIKHTNKGKKVSNEAVFDILGGKLFSKDAFVRLFYFMLYIVFLMMLYITNVYIAEDVSRDIYRLHREKEELHVESVFLRSEITRITKQSNLAKMLEDKGIKESVDPLKKIVIREEGGDND